MPLRDSKEGRLGLSGLLNCSRGNHNPALSKSTNLFSDQELSAANDVFDRIVTEAGEDTGTAIVIAASVAGAQMMRNTGIDFSEFEPGQYVLIDILNDQGMELLEFVDELLVRFANDPIDDWILPALVGTGPEETLLELTGKYEGSLSLICDRNGVDSSRRPQVMAAVIALIIHRASPVMDAATGKMIATQALVYGVKTVPPSFQL